MELTIILVVNVLKEIQKDEYIFIPYSKLRGGLMVLQPKFYKTTNNSRELGETLRKCIVDWENTPFVNENPPIVYEATGIKSNSKFQKIYSQIGVTYHTVDKLYKFAHCKKSGGNFLGEYSDESIPENATDEEVGELIKKAFEQSD